MDFRFPDATPPHLPELPEQKVSREGHVFKGKEANLSPTLLQRLSNVWNGALHVLDSAWRFIKNPIDHDWRKNQKYRHLMQELRTGFEYQLANGAIKHPKVKEFIELIKQTPGEPIGTQDYAKGSKDECAHHLEKALRALYDPQVPFDSERERFKAFTHSYLKALSTPYYKDLVKEGKGEKEGGLTAKQMEALEKDNTLVGSLHALAYVQFTGVNTLGFTQSVAREMAQVGGYTDRPNIKSLEGAPEDKREQLLGALEHECDRTHMAALAIDAADSRYNISWWTKLGATIKGHMSFMDFDPLHTGGNPANIHHTRSYADGTHLTFLRLPSPTIGSDISPDFKAYLRALKSRGQSHGYFNLQDRRSPDELPHAKDKIKASLGFPREDLRVDSLEGLNVNPEFAGVIHVITLDKNSPFYWQHDKKAGHKLLKNLVDRNIIRISEDIAEFKKRIDDKNEFAETFEMLLQIYQKHSDKREPAFAMQQKGVFLTQLKGNMLSGKSASFYLPESISSDQRRVLEKHLDDLAAMYFGDRAYLSPLERQNFIELSYDLMTDYCIRELKVNFANISCKDCIDRGEGQLALKEGKDLIMEILNTPDGNFREGLLQDIQVWHDTVHAAAIWARKRRILPEREVRLLNAMTCMLEMVRRDPARFQQVNRAAQKDIPVVFAPIKSEQRVKAFRKEMTGWSDEAYITQDILPSVLTDLFGQAVTPESFKHIHPQPPADDKPVDPKKD